MDHIDFAVFFVSFSIYLTGFGISFSLKNSRLKDTAKEFRFVAASILFILLLDLIDYYVDLLIGLEYPKWYFKTYSYLYFSAIILLAWRTPALAAAFLSVKVPQKTKKFFNMVCLVFLVFSLMLTGYNFESSFFEYAKIFPSLFLLLLSLSGSAVYTAIQLLKTKKERSNRLLFAFVLFFSVLATLEDTVISLFDNLKCYPYGAIMLGVFFLWLFIRERKSEPGRIARTMEKRLEELKKSYNLTDREMDVIGLLVDGEDKFSIGEQLFISANTVKSHISSIYRKLEISSRFELYALLNSEKTGAN